MYVASGMEKEGLIGTQDVLTQDTILVCPVGPNLVHSLKWWKRPSRAQHISTLSQNLRCVPQSKAWREHYQQRMDEVVPSAKKADESIVD